MRQTLCHALACSPATLLALICLTNVHAGTVTMNDKGMSLTAGDYTLLLGEDQSWTIRHFAYKGTPLMNPVKGCANGTVLRTFIDDSGKTKWVGTGHGHETVASLTLFVDGQEKPVKKGATYAGSVFKVMKHSDLHVVRLEALTILTKSGLVETNRYTAKVDKPPIPLLYCFMHSFDPAMTQWIAQTARGDVQRGQFVRDKTHPFDGDLVWTSVYNPNVGVGAAYAVLKPSGKLHHFYWDRTHDQKLYYRAYPDIRAMMAGDQFEYSVALAGYESPNDTWTNKAQAVARELATREAPSQRAK